MLFVGSPEKGYFVEEFAQKTNKTFNYVDADAKIRLQTNPILRYGNQDYTVFDIEQYIDDADTIAVEIARICTANNSKAIIYAAGYSLKSEIIIRLIEEKIKLFITSSSLSDMKDQLEKCTNGYMEANGIEEIESISLEEEKERIMINSTSQFIAIAGACSRMGTTTHAIQLVKYLCLNGYKACYIQMNNTEYLKQLKEWYLVEESEEDNNIGKITYGGVDHFYNIDRIADVLNLNYDYYVYDYGVYNNPNFNKLSFLEKNIKIFVMGNEPTELPFTIEFIRNAFYADVKYIFNFCQEKDRDDIKDLMDEKMDVTVIAPFIPDKYELKNCDMFEKLLPVENISPEPDVSEKKKKRGLFSHKKGAV